jgi:hypothetical protein
MAGVQQHARDSVEPGSEFGRQAFELRHRKQRTAGAAGVKVESPRPATAA